MASSSSATSSVAPRCCTFSTAPPSTRAATRSPTSTSFSASSPRTRFPRARCRCSSARSSSHSTRSTFLRPASSPNSCAPDLEARGYRVFEISTVTHEGLRQLNYALAETRRAGRRRGAPPVEAKKPRIVIRPKAVDEQRLRRAASRAGRFGNIYRVLGAKPERWVQQTDFTNDEAVGFLADRLAKLGVENELFKAGAVAGSTVIIGPGNGVVFDWEPTLTSTAELITAPRGTDTRLDDASRRTSNERREDYFGRMDAKAAAARRTDQRAGSRHLAGRRRSRHDPRRTRRPRGIGRGERVTVSVRDRAGIPSAKRIVVKVGSSSISGDNAGQIAPLVDALADAHGRGTEIVLVSSGAIATGMPYLRPRRAARRPRHPAGRGIRRPEPADLPLPGQPRPLRHRRRPGAADRRRPRERRPTAATRSGPWTACWPAHPADRERERHRRHPRDPLRRQRQPRRARRQR